MKKIIQGIFNLIGLEIKRKRKEKVKPQSKGNSMSSGLQRVSALGFPIKTVIDVGAAAGTWSVKTSHFWPNATYLMLEPLLERKEVLEGLTKQRSNFKFMPFAGGDKESVINFMVTDDLDGSGIASSSTESSKVRSVKVIRLDDAVRKLSLPGPYIVKLDTHGFEVPILEGCTAILDQVSIFIIECYGFQIVDNSLLFWEMCQFMDQKGFRLFDIVDVMHRSGDGAFWQCDAFFIRKDHGLFSNNRYKS